MIFCALNLFFTNIPALTLLAPTLPLDVSLSLAIVTHELLKIIGIHASCRTQLSCFQNVPHSCAFAPLIAKCGSLFSTNYGLFSSLLRTFSGLDLLFSTICGLFSQKHRGVGGPDLLRRGIPLDTSTLLVGRAFVGRGFSRDINETAACGLEAQRTK